jgi:hypothetical protein
MAARGGVTIHARVVPGRDVLDAERARAVHQALELDLRVAA